MNRLVMSVVTTIALMSLQAHASSIEIQIEGIKGNSVKTSNSIVRGSYGLNGQRRKANDEVENFSIDCGFENGTFIAEDSSVKISAMGSNMYAFSDTTGAACRNQIDQAADLLRAGKASTIHIVIREDLGTAFVESIKAE